MIHLPSERISASVHPVLFIICVLQGFPRQGPILIQPGEKILRKKIQQPKVMFDQIVIGKVNRGK